MRPRLLTHWFTSTPARQIIRSENGGRISNTDPNSRASSAKSAGRLPSRACSLNRIFRNGTTGIFLVRDERWRIGACRFWATASAMERPIRSILQTSSIRSSASSSIWKMKRRTSQALTMQRTMMSRGSGMLSLKMTLATRVWMNWLAVPSSELPWASACQPVRARVQNSPSWCWRTFRSTRRSSVRSMTASARGASRSTQ